MTFSFLGGGVRRIQKGTRGVQFKRVPGEYQRPILADHNHSAGAVPIFTFVGAKTEFKK